MTAVASYVDAIVRRAREPMEPRDFDPDWDDQPRRHKFYDGARHFPLPDAEPLPGTLQEGLLGGDPRGGAGTELGEWTIELLAALLRDSYGLTGRRLAVHGNPDLRGMPWFPSATWSRGAASGGGLYPLEIYWVIGRGGPLAPGIYNFSTPHHSMQRLLAGDVTAHVRSALPDDVPLADQYLLVSVKFWKNSFKYNSFAYHVVTMDLGALLGSWRVAARAAGLPIRPRLWFNEPELNRLLGLITDEESVFGVVPLPWALAPSGTARPEPVRQGDTGTGPTRAVDPRAGSPRPSVTLRETELSRRTLRFPQVTGAHAQTLTADGEPGDDRLAPARDWPPVSPGPVHLLPEPTRLDFPVTTALRERRSSFGRFSSPPELPQADLAAVLTAAESASTLLHSTGLSRVSVHVNHVDGLAQGSYDHLPRDGGLSPLNEHPVGEFLQRNYFLNNYNLEQCAAVLTVLARPRAVVEAAGPRGYRLVNAEVGAVTQSVYLACAALGIGCGAALGFDNVSYREELGLSDDREWPLIILMIGHERDRQPEFVYRNV
ncbi:SagB family peptide dehydrogenase [Nocardiopsis oceani]